MIDFVDKTSEQNGTPINRKNMMAIQGFITNTVVFNSDGSITETNDDNQIKTTNFLSDGNIYELFKGDKIIEKMTIFENDRIITEVFMQ